MNSKSKPNALPKPERALPATKWLPILDAAGLTPPSLSDAKTPHARAIKLGQWLSAKVGRELPVCIRGRNGKAVLRVIGARANEKRYYVEVTWDRPQKLEPPKATEGGMSKPKKKEKLSGKNKAATKPVGKRRIGRNDEG